MSSFKFAFAAVAASILFGPPALAEQQVLKFRLVVNTIESKTNSLDALPDRSLSLTKSVGVAVFEDGRLAAKDFFWSGEDGAEAGTYVGYSIYTFENGDGLTFRFTGSWSGDENGGDYELLSGSGAYAGATGTGRFDQVPVSWKDSSLFNGSFTLDVPGQ